MPERIYTELNNYIYIYHLNRFLVIPVYPESVSDNLQAQWTPTTPLARSAPIQSYSSSGPRTVRFQFTLHRDLMNQINYEQSNLIIPKTDDYLDTFVNYIQALSVPEYIDPIKMVNPPLAAIRIGDQIFCKGVIQEASLSYRLPIVETRGGKAKYAVVDLGFTIAEIDAYTASEIARVGSFRGLSSSLERKILAASGEEKALSPTDIVNANIESKTIFHRGANRALAITDVQLNW